MLDQAAGGHVDFGETYLEAAYRELKEELGLSAVPLKEIAVSYRNQDCFEGIYKGKIDSSTDFILNTKEVSGILWMPVAEFDKQVGNSSDIVPVLYVVWRDFKKQLLA